MAFFTAPLIFSGAALESHWTAFNGHEAVALVAGELTAPSGGDEASYYNVASYGPNWEIWVELGGLTEGRGNWIFFATNTEAWNGYFAFWEGSSYRIFRSDFSTLVSGSVTGSFVSGDKIAFKREGNKLKMCVFHGGTEHAPIEVTDSTYTGEGRAGVLIGGTSSKLKKVAAGTVVVEASETVHGGARAFGTAIKIALVANIVHGGAEDTTKFARIAPLANLVHGGADASAHLSRIGSATNIVHGGGEFDPLPATFSAPELTALTADYSAIGPHNDIKYESGAFVPVTGTDGAGYFNLEQFLPNWSIWAEVKALAAGNANYVIFTTDPAAWNGYVGWIEGNLFRLYRVTAATLTVLAEGSVSGSFAEGDKIELRRRASVLAVIASRAGAESRIEHEDTTYINLSGHAGMLLSGAGSSFKRIGARGSEKPYAKKVIASVNVVHGGAEVSTHHSAIAICVNIVHGGADARARGSEKLGPSTLLLTLKQHDRYPPLRAVLLVEGTPLNLNSALRVIFVMKSGTTTVEGECEIYDAAVGLVNYQWEHEDTSVPGLYNAEFKVEWAGGKIASLPSDEYRAVEVLKSV